MEKKLKVGSAAPRRLSIFFPKPPTSGAGFETKISKVRHLRAVFTLKKTQYRLLIKNSTLDISFYKKNHFLELIETPASECDPHVYLLGIHYVLPS